MKKKFKILFVLIQRLIVLHSIHGSIIQEDIYLAESSPILSNSTNKFKSSNNFSTSNIVTSSIFSSTSSSIEDDEITLSPVIPLFASPSLEDRKEFGDDVVENGIRFEEEPSDSYIVRSKSATLRCRTLNALNAWFTCNSGDERRTQSNQKISNYVNPQTGIRLIEIDLVITRSDVEEHASSGYRNPFQCWCTAYGGHHQIMSRKASISFAFLEKHFSIQPESVSVILNAEKKDSVIRFKCDPPSGRPKPIVFWMKNDKIILATEQTNPKRKGRKNSNQNLSFGIEDLDNLENGSNKLAKRFSKKKEMEENHFVDAIDDYEDDENVAETEAEESEIDEMLFGDDFEDEKLEIRKRYRNDETIRLNNFDLHSDSLEDRKKSKMLINYFMTDDNSLLIKNISVKDQANYTCGVYNVAGVRYSEPASLIISVNGEWSDWGDWSPCQLDSNLIEQGIQCGIGTQKRIRHCNNPSPVNNGEFCHGESIQVSECNILCPPIEGLWSSWTQWSICSQDCTQIKKRICKNLSSQYGESNCIGQDFMIQNCSGGLCRKTFEPNDVFHTTLMNSRHMDRVYFIIIFVLMTIILICVVYIAIKFHSNRRRNNSKSFQQRNWITTEAAHLPRSTCIIDTENLTSSSPIIIQHQKDQCLKKTGRSFKNYLVKQEEIFDPLKHVQKEPLISNLSHSIDKYHLISHLNRQSVEHSLVRTGSLLAVSHESCMKPPFNKTSETPKLTARNIHCKESQFRTPQPIRSFLGAESQASNPRIKAGTNSSTLSGHTASTTANDLSIESEPDYAEPMIDENVSVAKEVVSVPHFVPVRPIIDLASPKCPNRFSESSNPELSEFENILLKNIETMIKINAETIRFGYYSAMPNLGLGLYLPPEFVDIRSSNSRELYAQYGIDIESKLPGCCSLSPVITLNLSVDVKNQLDRFVILCFKHCLSFDHQKPLEESVAENLVVMHCEESEKSKWNILIRFNRNTRNDCLMKLDNQFVFLATKFGGKFMLAFLNDSDAIFSESKIDSSISKSINFTKIIELHNENEFLAKFFIHDDLPSSLLILHKELSTRNKILKLCIGRTKHSLSNSYSSFKLPLKVNSENYQLCLRTIATTIPSKSITEIDYSRISLHQLLWIGPNSIHKHSTLSKSYEFHNNYSNCTEIDTNEANDSIYQNETIRMNESKIFDSRLEIWLQESFLITEKTDRDRDRDQCLVLNHLNMIQLRDVSNAIECLRYQKCLRFTESELSLRKIIIEILDRDDSIRQRWTRSMFPFDEEVNKFNTKTKFKQDSALLELSESKIITETIAYMMTSVKSTANLQKESNNNQSDMVEIKQNLFSKLSRTLQLILPNDLADLIDTKFSALN